MTKRVIVTPLTKNSAHDVDKTLNKYMSIKAGWWDNTRFNSGEVGDLFYLVDNSTGNVVKQARVAATFKEDSGIGQVIIREWNGHKKGRNVLFLIDTMDVNFPLSSKVTKAGRVQGTERRHLI